MNALLKELIRLSDKLSSPDTPVEKKYKVLIAINEFKPSINDVHASKLGKAVKKCSNLSGKAGLLAQKLLTKWRKMIEEIQNNEEVNRNKKSKYHRSENVVSKPMKQEICQRANKDSNSENSYQSEASDDSETKFVSNLSKRREISPNSYRKNTDYPKNSQKMSKYKNNDSSSDNSFNDTDGDDDDDDGEYFQSNIENNHKVEKNEKFLFDENNKSKPMKSDKKSPESVQLTKPHKIPDAPVSKPLPTTKSSKSRKSESKHISTFEHFLMEGAISQQASESSSHSNHKRKSVSSMAVDNSGKKPKLSAPTGSNVNMDLLSYEGGPALPTLSRTDIDTSYMARQVTNHKVNKESFEDVDCTSKYSSERKIWVPNRKSEIVEHASSPEDVRMINGVSEHVIAQYDYEKLQAFEADNRKVMRQTEPFWEKLFVKVHKTYQRKERESWREAYLRVQEEVNRKLKELSARVRRNNDAKTQAVNKAKMLNSVPISNKGHRRMTDMRR